MVKTDRAHMDDDDCDEAIASAWLEVDEKLRDVLKESFGLPLFLGRRGDAVPSARAKRARFEKKLPRLATFDFEACLHASMKSCDHGAGFQAFAVKPGDVLRHFDDDLRSNEFLEPLCVPEIVLLASRIDTKRSTKRQTLSGDVLCLAAERSHNHCWHDPSGTA